MKNFLNLKRPRGLFPSVPSSLEYKDAMMLSLELPSRRTRGQPAPFLGLKSRLSQIPLNRWTVLLILVLVRVLITIGGLNQNIGDAKIKALQACTKVEDVGSSMASMPHYLSAGVNKVAVEGIDAAVRGMVQVLMMILTGVENLIYFVINFYVGTWVCLIAALIHGTLDIGTAAAEGATKLMNESIGKIADTLTREVADFQKGLNDFVGKISGLFGGSTPPTIDVTARVNDLKNIKVDASQFVKDIKTLKDNTPTFDDAQEFARKAIAIPFDKVRAALNTTTDRWAAPKDIFPLAQKETLSFCSDNSAITDFFESLYKIAQSAKIGFLVTIPILAVLVCIPMAMLEIRGYRRQKELARRMTRNDYDAMDVIYQASRPKSSRVGLWLSKRLKGTNREYLFRWAWAYMTSLPALFVLSLAIAGLFSCFCQWIILTFIQKEAPALVNKVGNFAEDVVRTLQGVSTKWATDSNREIIKFTDGINNDVLGHVKTATSAVNATLNGFQDEMNKRLDQVFAGTVLHKFAQDIVRCLIGIKLDTVEKGLNWVHDHAKVSLPLFPNDTFSAGAQQSIHGDSRLTSFLASPSTVTTDEITDAVYRVINFLRNGIITEALISAGLLLVYVILVLVGVIRALLNITGPNRARTRAEGGGDYHGHRAIHGDAADGASLSDMPPSSSSHSPHAGATGMAITTPHTTAAKGGYGEFHEHDDADRDYWADEKSEKRRPPPPPPSLTPGAGYVNNPYGGKI